jgi:hypothetical protein
MNMKRILAISSCVLIFFVAADAKDKGQSKAPIHSNAPAGTPHASADRDLGRDRAEDVGRGKKVGLDHTKKVNKGKHKGKKANQ